MKPLFLTIIALLFFVKAQSQEAAKTDSTVVALKTYLERKTRPSAPAVEDRIQGTVVIGFKIDDNKNIADLHIVKSFTKDCDGVVLDVMGRYRQPLSLPAAEYTLGVHFLIEGGRRKITTVPFDKSIYQNYLFDVDIKSIVHN